MPDIKEVLMEATQAGGAIIREGFEGDFAISHKEGINNLVTAVDTASEAAIVKIIGERFPDHTIISEEMGTISRGAEYEWIIDPIDGTVNFAHGVPICCVSIGVRHQGELLMGAVYNPMMDELFFAEKGQGAYLNGKKIQVSKKSDFRKAFLVTGFPYNWPGPSEHPVTVFEKFILQGLPVRRLGSAAIDLCWVACGRFDGFWEYNLQPWDVAAGYLIVTEAGGRVTNFGGQPADVFAKETLATNGHIHEAMMDCIRNK